MRGNSTTPRRSAGLQHRTDVGELGVGGEGFQACGQRSRSHLAFAHEPLGQLMAGPCTAARVDHRGGEVAAVDVETDDPAIGRLSEGKATSWSSLSADRRDGLTSDEPESGLAGRSGGKGSRRGRSARDRPACSSNPPEPGRRRTELPSWGLPLLEHDRDAYQRAGPGIAASKPAAWPARGVEPHRPGELDVAHSHYAQIG